MSNFVNFQFALLSIILIERIVQIIKHVPGGGYPRVRRVNGTEDALILFYLVMMIFWCLELIIS